MLNAISSREDLIRAVRRGLRPKYLFFWGHKPLPNGEIGESCLSQWWNARFQVGEQIYASAEHFMMAEKARLFNDEVHGQKILQAGSPKIAKQFGRQVQGFDEQTWAANRLRLVVAGNLAKFGQNRDLGQFLLQTGNKVLVEASPTDKVWGIGLKADDERAQNPELWRGLNLLGFALMEVREKLLHLPI
ncbi:MAG TPA: NADAR family protein [Pyrinomonadaceae bacterium]|nr:NADAR family protein [Pyrinomonadaceae bacterium]